VLEDCVGSYFPEFHEVALKMIAAQGGIFGWVAHSSDLLAALAALLRGSAIGWIGGYMNTADVSTARGLGFRDSWMTPSARPAPRPPTSGR
jgi:hypothetical protein